MMIMIQANKEVLTFNFMSTQKGKTKGVGGGGKIFHVNRKQKYPAEKQRKKNKTKCHLIALKYLKLNKNNF